jgi:hypothetical protein
MLLRLSSIWIIAYADNLVVICGSTVRLSRCLTKLSKILRKFWLTINKAKTEVVTFVAGPAHTRRTLRVKIGTTTLPRAHLFKYLGVVITSAGSLGLHQRAVAMKARIAAREVSRLFVDLNIRDLARL